MPTGAQTLLSVCKRGRCSLLGTPQVPRPIPNKRRNAPRSTAPPLLPQLPRPAGLGEMLRQSKLALKKSKRVDYYAVLEVEADAGEDAIKRAYRKAALKHHPDKVLAVVPACWLLPAAACCLAAAACCWLGLRGCSLAAASRWLPGGKSCGNCPSCRPVCHAWLPIHSPAWSVRCVQAGEADREAAEAKFKLVGEANSVLSDPQQRQRYDAGWSLEEIQQGFSNDGGGGCGGMHGGGFGGGGRFGGDDADLFAHLFASRMGGMGGGGSRRGYGGGFGGF